MNKEKILGFDVCSLPKDEVLNNIFYDYENGVQNVIVNINPEIVINNYKNRLLIPHKVRNFTEKLLFLCLKQI